MIFIGKVAKTPMKIYKRIEIECPGLGERIRSARKASGKTATELAFRAGMSSANWYVIEAEKSAIPIETLRAIEQALEVSFGIEIE